MMRAVPPIFLGFLFGSSFKCRYIRVHQACARNRASCRQNMHVPLTFIYLFLEKATDTYSILNYAYDTQCNMRHLSALGIGCCSRQKKSVR